jgi:signal transduction histidine kinase
VERSVLAGVAVFRVVAFAWLVSVVALTWGDVARPWLAVTLCVMVLAVTLVLTVAAVRSPDSLLHPLPVLIELAAGLTLVIAGGWVYARGHHFVSGNVIWPICGVLSAGVVLGPLIAAAAGGVFGIAHMLDAVAHDPAGLYRGRVIQGLSTGILYGLAGAVTGEITLLLRKAREETAMARAREEVARTLHDGVLQTLVALQRSNDATQMARMAREQERELRAFLQGEPRSPPGDLRLTLTSLGERFEDMFGGHVEVVVTDDVPRLPDPKLRALIGAVSEALTNAGKHGAAGRVTVFIEPAETSGVACWVKDDGGGFDTETIPEGLGIRRSIRERINDVGGRVEILTAPGAGTEVFLWLP